MTATETKATALITGASTGIGRATASLLARKGYKVFGGVRSPERVQPMPGVELVRVDVRDDVSVKACVDHVLDRSRRIDVLVNNAGYSIIGAVEETTIEQAQGLFDTNVFGVMRMIRVVLPAMRRAGSGLIVNVSSTAGFLPAPFMGLYASSKHAIEGLSESLDLASASRSLSQVSPTRRWAPIPSRPPSRWLPISNSPGVPLRRSWIS
jgi:NAD(P)-dependent dehydrogenase (short-subunit alcohol dehydrogenase family)